MTPSISNSDFIIISLDDELGVIVIVHIFKQLIHFLVIAISLKENAVP